jgi:hypothetical protein
MRLYTWQSWQHRFRNRVWIQDTATAIEEIRHGTAIEVTHCSCVVGGGLNPGGATKAKKMT